VRGRPPSYIMPGARRQRPRQRRSSNAQDRSGGVFPPYPHLTLTNPWSAPGARVPGALDAPQIQNWSHRIVVFRGCNSPRSSPSVNAVTNSNIPGNGLRLQFVSNLVALKYLAKHEPGHKFVNLRAKNVRVMAAESAPLTIRAVSHWTGCCSLRPRRIDVPTASLQDVHDGLLPGQIDASGGSPSRPTPPHYSSCASVQLTNRDPVL